MSNDLRNIQRHFYKYRDEYIVLGSGIVVGIALKGIFGKTPKIDEAAIVTNWMERAAMSGFNIYSLTNEQKALWEECFGWAIKAANSMRQPLPDVLLQMAKDYHNASIPGPGWTPPLA